MLDKIMSYVKRFSVLSAVTFPWAVLRIQNLTLDESQL